VKVHFFLNGTAVEADVSPACTVLTMLRDTFGLTGAKPGCEIGECGACSVLVDGKLVNACLLLAPQVEGSQVTTIEGIHAGDGGPNDLQQALLDAGAVQCGYCTPGMVLAGEALLAADPAPSRQAIREAIAGNLCRCTGYQQIIDAIQATAQRRRSAQRGSAGTPPRKGKPA
jgi:carbon-monoxide dehydrogenase small subunit